MSKSAVRALLIDLDDTLYCEQSYVMSGFAVIAGILARQSDRAAQEILYFMRYDFMKFGRHGAFDRVLDHFSIEDVQIASLVEAYRSHQPVIQLYPGVRDVLHALKQHYRLAIVTDGLGVMQQAKVAALELAPKVDEIIYCWDENAHKPDPAGFLLAAQKLNVVPERAMIVGDDPCHDMEAARRGGFLVCRVRSGRFAELEMPDLLGGVIEIPDFTALPALLKSRCDE